MLQNKNAPDNLECQAVRRILCVLFQAAGIMVTWTVSPISLPIF